MLAYYRIDPSDKLQWNLTQNTIAVIEEYNAGHFVLVTGGGHVVEDLIEYNPILGQMMLGADIVMHKIFHDGFNSPHTF